ncbi:tetratricopeptide repeat protein [Flavobacterium aquidurense]|uniref:tetratricopeptide repeat protein n=1 Tax=Flavobacterium aquidurense TaxID=362413 RepID=UPI0028570603|nr:tetratricopeptide repeat protein [Flavobacterium aquidurense]MDR7371752.1 tetratricopeptide (TPR) repeat protein [Flavobacterium aquidurense]
MNVTDYTYLINKPDAITEKQAEALGNVLNEFPYFQSARALRLKGLYNQNSFKYNYALKVTAAHTTDRSVLFDFITSENFTPIQGEYYDRKLRDLLDITVFESEIISAEEIKKAIEVRIDPIEQSILNSIKEATGTTFEKSEKIEEKTIDLPSEQSILDTFKEVTITASQESVKVEEQPIDLPSEQSILDTFKEVTTYTFEEPVKIEEKPIDPIIEQSILTSIKEASNLTFEEPTEIEESKTEVITDDEISNPIKGPTPTFFEDRLDDDEIPGLRIDPIEKSILQSIKEASTVVFEEAKPIEVEKPIEVKEVKTTEFEESEEIEVSEAVKTAEENLEIGKPLDFSANEKHSFQEWLQLAKTEPIDRTKDAPEELASIEQKVEKTAKKSAEPEIIDEEKKKKAEIIDKFIEANPKISPIKQTAIVPAVQFDINKEENSYLMTETLARVYLEQKKYTKAIQAYEILILKYPEKISFFADRISDIKILQQNNNNN